MSALGEYVHLHWANYKKYGLNRKRNDEPTLAEVTNIFNTQKQNMKNKIPKKTNSSQQNLENTLNGLVYPKGKNSTQVSDQLYNNLQQFCGELLIAWGGRNSLEAKYTNKISTDVKFSLTNLNSIKIEAEKVLNEITNVSSNIKRYDTLIPKLDALINTIKNINKKVSSTNTDSSGITWVEFSKNDKQLKENLIPEINNLLSSIAHSSRKKAIGDLWEYAIGSLDDRITDSISQTSDEIIKKVMVGSTSVKIDPITKIEKYQQNIRSVIQAKQDDRTKIEIGYTEGDNFKTVSKVDIDLVYQDESYKISAKNYQFKDPKYGMHLLQNSGFIDILLKNVDANFINHYLNIVASGGKKSSSWAEVAHQAAKSIIALEAITGLSQQGGGADYLVVNNRSAKKIKVIPMHEIINHQSWETFYSIHGYNKDKIRSYNKKYEDPNINDLFLQGKIRIDKLLQQLHTMKISASLNKKGLETFKIV